MPDTIRVNNKNNLLIPREAEALPLIALGKDNEEIGICMGCGQRTAKDYVLHSMQKLHACNRTHLVTEAFRHGYLEFLAITMMVFAVGITLVNDGSDIRSQRGRLRSGVRVTRITRIRGRQRELEAFMPINELIAA